MVVFAEFSKAGVDKCPKADCVVKKWDAFRKDSLLKQNQNFAPEENVLNHVKY